MNIIKKHPNLLFTNNGKFLKQILIQDWNFFLSNSSLRKENKDNEFFELLKKENDLISDENFNFFFTFTSKRKYVDMNSWMINFEHSNGFSRQ